MDYTELLVVLFDQTCNTRQSLSVPSIQIKLILYTNYEIFYTFFISSCIKLTHADY